MIVKRKELIALYDKIGGLSDRVSYLENYISLYDNTESMPPCGGYSGFNQRVRLTDIRTVLLELLEKLGYEIKTPVPIKNTFLHEKENKNE